MVATKGYGLSVDDIDWSSPADMKPYLKAHEEELKEKDYLAWLFNQYTLSAISVAVEHCLAGRKARSKYIKEPIFQSIEKKDKFMTQDELQKQRELFVARFEAMGANFRLSQKSEGGTGS